MKPFDQLTIHGKARRLQNLALNALDHYEPLYWALREGYESRLEWPDHYKGQIDTFQAARRLWVANYIAQFEPEQLKAWIEWLAPQFERFLETGLLRKS